MNESQTQLYQRFLTLFRHYDTPISHHLIALILVQWGRQLAKLRLPPPTDLKSRLEAETIAREPAHLFMQAIKQAKLDHTSPRMHDPGRQLGSAEDETEANRWAAALARLPLEETMQIFAAAASEWLLTCDLSQMKQPQWSDAETIKWILYWWSSELAVA